MVVLFILQRLLYAVMVLLIVTLVMFWIIEKIPGTYCDEPLSGQRQSICKRIRDRFGLDQPFYIQYARWVQNVALHGNLGYSLAPPYEPAWQAIAGEGRLGNSLLIATLTLICALLVAVPAALYSATRRHSLGDRTLALVSVLGLSLPNFLVGLLILEVLVGWLQVGRHWGLSVAGLPSYWTALAGWDPFWKFLWHLWPVILVAGSVQTAEVYRRLRGALADICSDPWWLQRYHFARTRAQRFALYAQATHGALASLASWFGLWFALMFEGIMIAGVVLNVSVMEFAFWTAVRRQDVYVALAGVVLFSSLLMAANLLVDLFLLVGSRPRIRYD
jgi:peptide/nickel transport system permease protein